jgi:hypothetical protein
MSWSVHAVPLHELANEDMAEWATAASFSRGVPQRAPSPLPLPSAAEVLAAFRHAECHGSAWFTVSGIAPRWQLPECPDPDGCSRSGGRDLGEVSLLAIGSADGEQPIPMNAAVKGVSGSCGRSVCRVATPACHRR